MLKSPFLQHYILPFIVLSFFFTDIYGQDRNTIECIENGCDDIIGGGNRYLLSRTALQSDYDLEIAKKLLKCKCLEKQGGEFKGLISRLQKMIDDYQAATSNCNIQLCENLVSNSNGMTTYGSSDLIDNQKDYETAKKIVENCDCWATTQGAVSNQYLSLFIKMRKMIVSYEQRLAEKQRLDEATKQKVIEEQKQAELAAQQKANKDSLEKLEMPKEIAALLNKPGRLDECVSKCKEYSDKFGEEPEICKNAVAKKIKTLMPTKITSQEIADIYFTPKTELTEWYMEGKQSGYVQVGGDVTWVSGNLAEMNMGSQFIFLIKFSSPWIVRKGMTIMGYGKSIGNITYTTAIGGRRTLPCLKLVWMYRPSLDKSTNSEE